MAKKQTRRTVSLNIKVYRALQWAAAAANKNTAEYLTDLIRDHVPDIPQTKHYNRLWVANAMSKRGYL